MRNAIAYAAQRLIKQAQDMCTAPSGVQICTSNCTHDWECGYCLLRSAAWALDAELVYESLAGTLFDTDPKLDTP